MRILFLVVLVYIINSEVGSCQKFLLLEKNNYHNQVYYYLGNGIRFKTFEDRKVTGTIMDILDSSVIVNTDSILLKDIDIIYKQRWFFSLFSKGLETAGIGYFLLETVNNIINGRKTIIAGPEILTSGILIGSGFLLSLLDERKCRIQKKWRLKVIDFNKYNKSEN